MEIESLASRVYLGAVFARETRHEVLRFCSMVGLVRHLFATEPALRAKNEDCALHFDDLPKIIEFFTNFEWNHDTAEHVSKILLSIRSAEQLDILSKILTIRIAQLPPSPHQGLFDYGVAQTILNGPLSATPPEPNRIAANILAQFFSETDFLAEVKLALTASLRTPGTPCRLPDMRFQVVYNLPSDSFVLHIFDRKHAYVDEGTFGTSKNIKSTVIKIWIRNILGWEFFLGAANQDFVARGWQLVSVARNSPVFRSADSDPRQVLMDEGFTRELKTSKSGHLVEWYVAPYKGVSLTTYKKEMSGELSEEFLRKLFYFLLSFIERNHFVGMSDLKPDNILYNAESDTFTVIDYFAPGAVSPAFYNVRGYPSSPSTDRRRFALHILSDNIVFSIYYLLDKNGPFTARLINTWLTDYLVKLSQPSHLFFEFLAESAALIATR